MTSSSVCTRPCCSTAVVVAALVVGCSTKALACACSVLAGFFIESTNIIANVCISRIITVVTVIKSITFMQFSHRHVLNITVSAISGTMFIGVIILVVNCRASIIVWSVVTGAAMAMPPSKIARPGFRKLRPHFAAPLKTFKNHYEARLRPSYSPCKNPSSSQTSAKGLGCL